ncbi:MAG TPA: rhamnulokinase family protein [Solirubrobacteraceae bacterium]|nr:rhamnulokinase family protein [Solirubrobacteraceae bacterium]
MPDYAAIDLGAESGRVVVGRLDGEQVALDVVHRFNNRPVRLPDGMHWNLMSLFAESLTGLGFADGVDGIGIDAWGVDYALLDGANRVLGLPFHYRDPRTNGMIERAYARVPREELYATAGIQTLPINTVFQLLADEGTAALAAAERIALVPDLFALWLTGVLANESTAASTTGLLDARSATWARDLIARLGLPACPFAGDPVEPGVALAPVLEHHGLGAVPVHMVAGHDTASAFAAAPIRSPRAAVLSSGTWSLLGLELDAPVLTQEAAACNLTNERGIEGTIRLLRNVMGLWLLQECRRAWDPSTYDDLARMAAAAPRDVALFDPDDERFLAPGDMPARIASACRAAGQEAPATKGEFARSILTSLACKYRVVLDQLQRVTGRDVDVVHVIGGGARNGLLCQLTADVLGIPVLAGPVEATALGNVLVQARATRELGSFADLRAVAAASAQPVTYEPGDAAGIFERFVERTTSESVA